MTNSFVDVAFLFTLKAVQHISAVTSESQNPRRNRFGPNRVRIQ